MFLNAPFSFIQFLIISAINYLKIIRKKENRVSMPDKIIDF